MMSQDLFPQSNKPDWSASNQQRYSITIYATAPNTPKVGEEPSLSGHVYYKISNGKKDDDLGYGFGPTENELEDSTLTKIGNFVKGKVHPDEFEKYLNPAYERTMEITKGAI